MAAEQSFRTEFRIESKEFKVRRDGLNIEIRESGKNYISIVIVSPSLARWIAAEMKKLGRTSSEGYVSKHRDGNAVGILSIRSNAAGLYLSILIIPSDNNKSCMALCIPRRRNGSGWVTFRESIEEIMLRSPSMAQPNQERVREMMTQSRIGFEEMGGSDCFIVRKGFEDLVKNLASKGVVASFNNYSYHWKFLIGDLDHMFKFSRQPTVSPIGGNSYLIKCNTTMDAELLVKCAKMIVDGTTVTFRAWNKSSGTIKPYKNPCRWIELIGLPVHLMNREVVTLMCSNFGTVERIETLKGIPNQMNCLQVLLVNANMFRMPQFISVAEDGVAYPVRISASINEIYNPGKSLGDSFPGENGSILPDPSLPNLPDPSPPQTAEVQNAVVQNLNLTSLPDPPTHPITNQNLPSIPLCISDFPPFPPLTTNQPRISVPISYSTEPSIFNPPPQHSTTHPFPHTIRKTPVFHQSASQHQDSLNPPISSPHNSSRNSANPSLSLIPIPCSTNPTHNTQNHLDSLADVASDGFLSQDSGDDSEHYDEENGEIACMQQPADVASYVAEKLVEQPATNTSNLLPSPIQTPTPESPTVPPSDPTEKQIEDDDCFVSDSGEDSDHCAEDLEPIEVPPQGPDVVEFITKKLEVVKKVLADVKAKRRLENKEQSHKEVEAKKNSENNLPREKGAAITEGHENSTPRVEQGEVKAATNKNTSETLTTKKVSKIATRSARRRKRGALLLQSEEFHLEST